MMDLNDSFRHAYLSILFERMETCPLEKARILGCARTQLSLQKERGLSGSTFQARWEQILDLDVTDMKVMLLAKGEMGSELRHSHMFAGCLPPREFNKIRQDHKARFENSALISSQDSGNQ